MGIKRFLTTKNRTAIFLILLMTIVSLLILCFNIQISANEEKIEGIDMGLERTINWDLVVYYDTSFLNPARTSTLKQSESSYFYYDLLNRSIPFKHYYIIFSLEEKGAIGGFYSKIDFSEILGYKWVEKLKGINFSKSINKNFYWGINYKKYELEIFGGSATGNGFDIGFLRKFNDKSILQIALINLDTKIKYSTGTEEKAPQITTINFSSEPFKNIPLKIMLKGDKSNQTFNKDWNFTLGIGYRIKDKVGLRIILPEEGRYLIYGFTGRIKNFYFDYDVKENKDFPFGTEEEFISLRFRF